MNQPSLAHILPDVTPHRLPIALSASHIRFLRRDVVIVVPLISPDANLPTQFLAGENRAYRASRLYPSPVSARGHKAVARFLETLVVYLSAEMLWICISFRIFPGSRLRPRTEVLTKRIWMTIGGQQILASSGTMTASLVRHIRGMIFPIARDHATVTVTFLIDQPCRPTRITVDVTTLLLSMRAFVRNTYSYPKVHRCRLMSCAEARSLSCTAYAVHAYAIFSER